MNKMNDQIIEWKDPDGTIKKLNFDDDGNLIGTKSKEDTTKPINKRTRYYSDGYGGEFHWTTHKQQDGKFQVTIKKLRRGWIQTVKTRSFTKKKTAIKYCLKLYLKSKEQKDKVHNARAIRKQVRLDLKPKGKEKSRIEAKEKLQHFIHLSINVDRQRKELNKNYKKQLRSFATRQKTYRKKTKYYKKRVEVLK